MLGSDARYGFPRSAFPRPFAEDGGDLSGDWFVAKKTKTTVARPSPIAEARMNETLAAIGTALCEAMAEIYSHESHAFSHAVKAGKQVAEAKQYLYISWMV
jgi:hypothetical protein